MKSCVTALIVSFFLVVGISNADVPWHEADNATVIASDGSTLTLTDQSDTVRGCQVTVARQGGSEVVLTFEANENYRHALSTLQLICHDDKVLYQHWLA